MKAFSELVDKLYFVSSTKAKTQLIIEYLRTTPDPDRGWAIAAIAGALSFDLFKRKMIKDLMLERVDQHLFDLSYDYVGEMSETVAHLWSTTSSARNLQNSDVLSLPTLDEFVIECRSINKIELQTYIVSLLDVMNASQRWAMLKLGTGGLRVGVSTRMIKNVLAQYAQQCAQSITTEDIERVWHGVEAPYTELLHWIEGTGTEPNLTDKLYFQPVMLAHPIEQSVLDTINPKEWIAEWKYDGIRVQYVSNHCGQALYSRNGDDISNSFPDLLERLCSEPLEGRFDGELVALNSEYFESPNSADLYSYIASFNQLQQRLNKKRPTKKLMASHPVGLIVYDILQCALVDVRDETLEQRQRHLIQQLSSMSFAGITHSKSLEFESSEELLELKEHASETNHFIEGLMIKRRSGHYAAGRPQGQWYKLKRDPKLIDAVIMYAQRGHGKRSSYYSDFTFGCWQGDTLLPVGKAYSGFTDEELKKLDTWVRRNTIARFGPVKEVNKTLVFEIAFDSVHASNRHKSKVAMRFPRIHRIRWDKPAIEADSLSSLIEFIQ